MIKRQKDIEKWIQLLNLGSTDKQIKGRPADQRIKCWINRSTDQ